MNPKSISSYIFSSIRANFISSEFTKEELEEHKEECLIKSNLSEEQFRIRLNEIEQSIIFFQISEYKSYLDEAISLISDPDDVDILALALKRNAEIWSNDFHLREQSKIRVLTTEGLVGLFLKGEV
jgi:predicted nucleic acid-binding protein